MVEACCVRVLLGSLVDARGLTTSCGLAFIVGFHTERAVFLNIWKAYSLCRG